MATYVDKSRGLPQGLSYLVYSYLIVFSLQGSACDLLFPLSFSWAVYFPLLYFHLIPLPPRLPGLTSGVTLFTYPGVFPRQRKPLRVEHTMEKSIKADEYPDHTVTREFSEDGKIEQGQSGLNDPNHVELHRALKARHITMIGTCGAESATSMR